MGVKDWTIAGVIVLSVVGPTAHGDLHLHPEECVQVITTDNISMVQTTGNYILDAEPGFYAIV